MIKKQYAGNLRRARNIIWNAAGRYDFDPPFMAFFPNGTPDNYFNMVAGFVCKWLDMAKLQAFFESYESSHRADEFDDYLWLGLENCVYEKEVVERPLLEELRRERAERFYLEQQSLSRQQMQYQSMATYNQQEYRWALISGKRPPILTPREKKMAAALSFPGTLDTEGVLQAMREFLSAFFHYSPDSSGTADRKNRILTSLLFRREHRHEDKLLVRIGSGSGDHEKAVQQRHDGLGKRKAPTEKDAAYIQGAFGSSSIAPEKLRALEHELCIGIDEGCRLHVTKGILPDCQDKDILEIRESAERQKKRNQAYLTDHASQISSSIKSLTIRMDTVFSSYFRHMPELSRKGRICPELAYRIPVLNDGRVFLKNGEDIEVNVTVELLLDASRSRMNSQEVLSAESMIIAKSLEKLHIPVRVSAFRSLRGYTVLEILKDWEEKGCDGLTRYYAGGWNRDALAIEAAGKLSDFRLSPDQTRIFLILTDGSPNDSTPIAAEGLHLPREYEGAAAVSAASEAVRNLRSSGVKVGAVFHGNTSHLENIHQIYGHSFVRIRKAGDLSDGVSNLILSLLRETRRD